MFQLGKITAHEGNKLVIEFEEDINAEYLKTLARETEATQWIKFLIEFILEHGVPLEKRYSYLLEYDDFFYFACKYRKCCICGKSHAQIHHVTVVGNRKRNNVDHRVFYFASLCWVHHNIAHTMSLSEFLKTFKITPVLLDREALIKIGIMSNAQIMRFDEKYETEELFKKAIELKTEGENGTKKNVQ